MRKNLFVFFSIVVTLSMLLSACAGGSPVPDQSYDPECGENVTKVIPAYGDYEERYCLRGQLVSPAEYQSGEFDNEEESTSDEEATENSGSVNTSGGNSSDTSTIIDNSSETPPNGAARVHIVAKGSCEPTKKNGKPLEEGFIPARPEDDGYPVYGNGATAQDCWLLPNGLISSEPFGTAITDPVEIQEGVWAYPIPIPDMRGYIIEDVRAIWKVVYREPQPEVLDEWNLEPGEDVTVVTLPGQFSIQDGELVIYSLLAFTPGSERDTCFGTWAHMSKHFIVGEYTVSQIWRLLEAIENGTIQPVQTGVSNLGIDRAVLLYAWEGMKILLFIGADIGPSIYSALKSDALANGFAETQKVPFRAVKDAAIEFTRCMRQYLPKTVEEKAQAEALADAMYRRPAPPLPVDFPGDVNGKIVSNIPPGYVQLGESGNYLVPEGLQFYSQGDIFVLAAIGILVPVGIACTAAPEVCIPAGSALLLRYSPAMAP